MIEYYINFRNKRRPSVEHMQDSVLKQPETTDVFVGKVFPFCFSICYKIFYYFRTSKIGGTETRIN